MRKLIEYIKRLFALDEENEILEDDDDYRAGVIMHYIRPEEEPDDHNGKAEK